MTLGATFHCLAFLRSRAQNFRFVPQATILLAVFAPEEMEEHILDESVLDSPSNSNVSTYNIETTCIKEE